jgi:hypothetical protein
MASASRNLRNCSNSTQAEARRRSAKCYCASAAKLRNCQSAQLLNCKPRLSTLNYYLLQKSHPPILLNPKDCSKPKILHRASRRADCEGSNSNVLELRMGINVKGGLLYNSTLPLQCPCDRIPTEPLNLDQLTRLISFEGDSTERGLI